MLSCIVEFTRFNRSYLSSRIRVYAAGIVAIIASGGWCGTATADEFSIANAETRLVDQVYRLTAQLNYSFSDQVMEALNNGVPMVLVLDIELLRARRFIWNETIASLQQRFELYYHALTEQYIVKNLNSGAKQTFPTLNIALSRIGGLSDIPLIDQQLLDPNQVYKVRLQARLELESLPAPLRLSAYISRSWWLSSDWYYIDLVE